MRYYLAMAAVLVCCAVLLAMPFVAMPTLTPTQTPTPTPTHLPTPTPTQTTTPLSGGAVLATVTAHALNVRACAGVGCAIIGALRRGDSVQVLAGVVVTSDGATWRRVSVAGGLTGWVNSFFLEVQNDE